MSEFLSARATADRLIKKKGGPVTITRVIEGEFDPVTQTHATTETVVRSLRAVKLPPASARRFGVDLTDRVAEEFYFSHVGEDANFVPAPGDVVTFGATRMVLFWSQTYDPAGDGPVLTVAFGEARAV